MMWTEVSRPQPPPMYASNGDRGRQPRDDDARFQIDFLRPAAEESVGGRVGDAVDPARRTSGRRPVHGAGQTPAARAMHVEERDAVAFREWPAFDVEQPAAHGVERARS